MTWLKLVEGYMPMQMISGVSHFHFVLCGD